MNPRCEGERLEKEMQEERKYTIPFYVEIIPLSMEDWLGEC